MSKIQYVAIIIIIITMVCLLIIPRLYYHKEIKNFTNNPADITDIIKAIYATSGAQVNAIYATSVVQIGLLGGMIVALMGLIISLQK